VTEDAFRHLPALRVRITPPEQSALRMTAATLARWDEAAKAQGRPPDWRWSDERLESSRREFVRTLPPGDDLWVFAYGSLMWDPGFHFDEVRLATLGGRQRRFSYRTAGGRGTPQDPALMLTLEVGDGCCHGLAYRIAAAQVDAELPMVWRREMVRGGYRPTRLGAASPQGDIAVLAFAANPAHPEYVGELPLHETAAIVARAEGVLGSNRDYLEQLAQQLDCLGIDDDYVTLLLRQVRTLRGGQGGLRPPAADDFVGLD
jgi:cation transport protein ChaC